MSLYEGPRVVGAGLPHGNIVRVVGSSVAAYSKGHVMRLTPTSTDAVTQAAFDAVDFDDFGTIVIPAVPAVTDVGADAQSGIYGVLLQDLADETESGWALVRGYCLAMVDVITTTLTADMGMYVGDGATTNTLQNVRDVATTIHVKIIARSRYSGSIASGTAIGLFPVLFNGVEGFLSHKGV